MRGALMQPLMVSVCPGMMAPDVTLDDNGRRPSDYRGQPLVIVFPSDEWDPARDDVASRTADWYRTDDGVKVVVADQLAARAAFGVDTDAVFAIDATGVIRERYVAGVDSLPAPEGVV